MAAEEAGGPQGAERREHPRAEIPVTVDVRVGDEVRVCFAADLSVGGVRLNDLHDANSGDTVALLIQLRDDKVIEVEGEVKWTSEEPTGSVCGIEFVALDGEDRERIQELVDATLRPAEEEADA